MTIGERIKMRREELGLSVNQLARKLSKDRATVYRYENNYIENMPIQSLEPLAIALQTSPAYLMGWTDKLDSRDTTALYVPQHDMQWFEKTFYNAESYELVRRYISLTDDGKKKVDVYIDDLIATKIYNKTNNNIKQYPQAQRHSQYAAANGDDSNLDEAKALFDGAVDKDNED